MTENVTMPQGVTVEMYYRAGGIEMVLQNVTDFNRDIYIANAKEAVASKTGALINELRCDVKEEDGKIIMELYSPAGSKGNSGWFREGDEDCENCNHPNNPFLNHDSQANTEAYAEEIAKLVQLGDTELLSRIAHVLGIRA